MDEQEDRGVPLGVWRDSDLPDEQEKEVVFGVLDRQRRLIPKIRNEILKEDVFNFTDPGQDKEVDLDSILFAPHLDRLKHDTRALTEYCYVCLSSINQGKPLSTSDCGCEEIGRDEVSTGYRSYQC